jgi:hypothetical protein
MGCLLAVFVYPFRFLKYCFTNGWKGLIILAVVIVIGVIGFVVVKSNLPNIGIGTTTTTVKTATTTIAGVPSTNEAPFVVITQSRYYYAKKAVQKDGITTLTTYWEQVGNKWVKFDTTLTLDRMFGKVTIKRR